MAWERNAVPFPKLHGAFWGRTAKWGERSRDHGLWRCPCLQTRTITGLETPNYCPAHPHPSGSVRRGGRTHSSFLGPEKLSTQLLPAGLEPSGHFRWLRLLWAPAHLPTTGFLPGLLRGTESDQGRNRSRTLETGLRFRFRTVTLWARALPLSRGWAGTKAHHPPLMGPGQGPAGC